MATFLLNHGQLVLTGFLFQSIPEGNRWIGFIAGHISSLSPIQQSFAHPGLENIAIFSVENVGYMSDIYIWIYIADIMPTLYPTPDSCCFCQESGAG